MSIVSIPSRPRSGPGQSDTERLVRIESKLTKVAKAFGVNVLSSDAPPFPTRILVNEEGLHVTSLDVTLGELYEAAEQQRVEYPVWVFLHGRELGTLNAPHRSHKPEATA